MPDTFCGGIGCSTVVSKSALLDMADLHVGTTVAIIRPRQPSTYSAALFVAFGAATRNAARVPSGVYL